MTDETQNHDDCDNSQQKKASHMYRDLPEGEVNAEVVLLEKYQAFSAEIVRLSLLGIVVFGFLFKEVFAKAGLCDMDVEFPVYVGGIAVSSIVVFSVATVSALRFRYLSTEALRYFVEGLRRHEGKKNRGNSVNLCLERRDKILNRAYRYKVLSVGSFGLGAAMLGFFVAIVLYEIWGSM